MVNLVNGKPMQKEKKQWKKDKLLLIQAHGLTLCTFIRHGTT
ncbi:hypothetical protein [Paenibacillus baekrokdamisoli]|nr:hypothetical protein [Paenibacillus baekrokdamisoli]